MQENWEHKPRWVNIKRPYSGDDVLRLRGSIKIEHTIAQLGAQRLWSLLLSKEIIEIPTIDTGHQAQYYIHSGFEALYLDGQLDLSFQANKTLQRIDEANFGEDKTHWCLVPTIFGIGEEHSQEVAIYEITRQLIEAGVAGIRLRHSFATPNALIKKIVAVRLAADVCSVPLVIFVDTIDPDQAKACSSYCEQIIPQNSNECKVQFLSLDKTHHLERVNTRQYAHEVEKIITQD